MACPAAVQISQYRVKGINVSSNAVYVDRPAFFIFLASRFSFNVFCGFFLTSFLVSRLLAIQYPFLTTSYSIVSRATSLVSRIYPPSQKAMGVNPWMNAKRAIIHSLGEGWHASAGFAKVGEDATAVKPWSFTLSAIAAVSSALRRRHHHDCLRHRNRLVLCLRLRRHNRLALLRHRGLFSALPR